MVHVFRLLHKVKVLRRKIDTFNNTTKGFPTLLCRVEIRPHVTRTGFAELFDSISSIDLLDVNMSSVLLTRAVAV